MVDPGQAKYEVNWYPYTAEKYALFSRLLDGFYGDGWLGTVKGLIAGNETGPAVPETVTGAAAAGYFPGVAGRD